MGADAISRFQQVASQELKDHLDQIGLLIYTPASTLKQNDVIYWGFNPGQNPEIDDETHWTISQAIKRFPEQKCKIHEEDWPNTRKGILQNRYRARHGGGKAPYQIGVATLLDAIGHPDALVSNLAFLQTARAHQVDGDVILKCLTVHKCIFDICQPKALITTRGVIDKLQAQSSCIAQVQNPGEPFESGYGVRTNGWKCQIWPRVQVLGHELVLVKTPHMSYWSNVLCPKKRPPSLIALEAVEKIRNFV